MFTNVYHQFLKKFEPAFRLQLQLKRKEVGSIASGSFFSYLSGQALAPSKRVRPFLIYVGYKCAGGKSTHKALLLGTAMELMHTSLLIQDDVIDLSSTRRGMPTIHERVRTRYWLNRSALHYGMSTAILEANFGINIAYQIVRTIGDEAVNRIFYEMFSEVTVGQQIDIDLPFHKLYKNKRLIEKVLELKSGRYSIDRPLALGLALAGKSKWIPDFLSFSNPLGRVFQVTDDYLGIFGDEKELGKSTDSDLKEGKATLVIYYGLKKATPVEQKKILNVLGNQAATPKEIREVKTILKPYVERPIRRYIEQQAAVSLSRLNRLAISDHYKTFFQEFIEYLKNRKK